MPVKGLTGRFSRLFVYLICFASILFFVKITHYANSFLLFVHLHQYKWYTMLPKESARASTLVLNNNCWLVDSVEKHDIVEKIRTKSYRKSSNRPFARSGHLARNKLNWDANYAVGLSKQRKAGLDWYEFLCFGSRTA